MKSRLRRVLLEEVINDPDTACIDAATGKRIPPGEDSFWQDRFRPLVEHENISVFRKILDEASAAVETSGGALVYRKHPQAVIRHDDPRSNQARRWRSIAPLFGEDESLNVVLTKHA